jgi:hypothetical protein
MHNSEYYSTDSHLEQIKQENTNKRLKEYQSDPMTAKKFSNLLCEYTGGVRYPMGVVDVWFKEYLDQGINGKCLSPLEFIETLSLNDLY